MKKAQQGFTIIEIVVALVVLGILMGAAATQLNRFRATSYQTAANNIALSMQQAINMKYASISQALSAGGITIADCKGSATGTTPANLFCASAYEGAINLLSSTGAAKVEICGMEFKAAPASGAGPSTHVKGPFASGADLGGGWTMKGTLTAGSAAALAGPDGNTYNSEVPILATATFCN